MIVCLRTQNSEKMFLFGNKNPRSASIVLLFSAFGMENIGKEDINQRLECAAHKIWSKYTTSEPLEQLYYHKEE